MIRLHGKHHGRKPGAKNTPRREPAGPRREKKSRSSPRKDLSLQEFQVMKERLKFQRPAEAAREPVLGTIRSVSLFVKVMKMESFQKSRKGSSTAWNEENISQVIARIEESPTMSLQQIVQWSNEQGFPRVSVSTLHRYLDLKLITYKVGKTVPFARNSEATKSLRVEYAN